MPIKSTFSPPYLDYGVPADLKKIQAQMAAIWKSLPLKSATLHSGTPVSVFTATPNPRVRAGVDPARLDASMKAFEAVPDGNIATAEIFRAAGNVRAQAFRGQALPAGAFAQFEALAIQAEAPPPPAPNKSAASLVSVKPNGMVPVGFNCWKTFQAEAAAPGFLVSFVVWKMLLKNKSTPPGTDQLYYMGWTNSSSDPNPFPMTVEFSHMFDTYSTMAYTSSSNKVEFVIECQYFPDDNSLPIRTERSAWVTLDFNTPACLGLHSMSVSHDTFVGGENGSEPTLTVALDKPAGPGGQKVLLSTTNNLGRIMHSPSFKGWFLIPAGQTSASVSWFLGTRQVVTTGKSFHIEAVLDSPGGQSNKGVVEIHLTKKKKK